MHGGAGLDIASGERPPNGCTGSPLRLRMPVNGCKNPYYVNCTRVPIRRQGADSGHDTGWGSRGRWFWSAGGDRV